MAFKNPIASIREHVSNYSMFRKGIMPPDPRFDAHFSREIGRIAERYYPAADVSVSRQDWNPSVLVDQNVLRLEYRRIYARAKKAYDTDPYARNAVRALQSQIVGRGISPRARPLNKDGVEDEGTKALGKELDSLWQIFNDQCFRPDHDSFYDVQYKYVGNCCISGGLFLNYVPSQKGNKFPFAFQQIDQSYIEFSHDNFAMPVMPMIFNGVQVNEFGEAQHYYFQDLLTWMFFDMPANNMIHGYEKWHFNQFIGIPWLAPVLTTLWDLSQLQEDRIIASRIQAAIALWVSEDSKAFNPSQKNNDGNISLSPGKVFKSKVKPEIIQASDSIKDTYGAMLDLYLQQVAVGMGISFQELTTDTRGATFSSSRTTVQDRRRYYQKKQEFVKRTFCQPVYDKFVQWAFLSGFISGKTISDFRQNKWGFCRAVWTPDRWAWVDPLKDMQALIAETEVPIQLSDATPPEAITLSM